MKSKHAANVLHATFLAPVQFPNPPSRVEGAPVFSRTKRRESYFKEFQSKKGKFDEDRVKAHRLSVEAAAYSEEVNGKK